MPTEPLRFFISYAHEDEEFKNDLMMHLSSLKRQGLVSAWDDRQIPAGGEWDKNIKSELTNADVVLLLISPYFLNSEYCNDVEVAQAIQSHNDTNDETVVVPIILRPCDWTGAIFAKLQALPKNAQPVTRWPDKHEAYLDAVKSLKLLIQRINQNRNAGDVPGNSPVADIPPQPSNNAIVDPSEKASVPREELDAIRNLVASGKTERAIDQLMAIAKTNNADSYNQLILLSGRLTSVNRDSNMGLISSQEANRTHAQINYALLEMLKDV